MSTLGAYLEYHEMFSTLGKHHDKCGEYFEYRKGDIDFYRG